MKALDPDAYMEIPEHYKVGLKSEEHFHLVAAERTQEKVAARVTVIASNPSWTGLPWTAAQLKSRLDPVQAQFATLIKNHMVYPGFTFRSGKDKEAEWARFATSTKNGHNRAFTRRDNVPLRDWADLHAMGFEVCLHAVPTSLHSESHTYAGCRARQR
jgi:hypothetical protein